jgi:Ca2+-binding RTX toxin-like protein
LEGNYNIALGASLANVENIVLLDGFDYSLTSNNANVAAGQTMTVDGSDLSGRNFSFYGSAETDGKFVLIGGASTDRLTGGAGDDVFDMGGDLAATDSLTGGAGNDTLELDGDYSAGLVFNATTIVGIEKIVLAAGNSYGLTLNDANLAFGQTLTVDGSALCGCGNLVFDGSAETNGILVVSGGESGDILTGGLGNDTLTGNDGGDTLNIANGGNDKAYGGADDDTIIAGAALNTADIVDGGDGNDTLTLAGNYNIALGAGLTNVETITLATGFNYALTSNNTNVAAGQTLTIDGSALGSGNQFTVFGSAETDGKFAFIGGAGIERLIGGNGDDTFAMGAGLAATDRLTGGAGNDTVYVGGDYNLTLSSTTLLGVENIVLADGHNYNLTSNNATVAAGSYLRVDGAALGSGSSLIFNGAAETDGVFLLFGGAGNDVLTGGAGGDYIVGGGGGDTMTGGNGADYFVYGSASESTSTGYDKVVGFSFAQDVFELPSAITVIDSNVTGSLSTGNFDSDLTAAINASTLGAGHAVLFQATSGSLSGHTFLIADANNTAGYQAGLDHVIELVTPTGGGLGLSNFVAAS